MRKILVGASAAAVLALAGCSSQDSGHSAMTTTTTPSVQSGYNTEDVTFAQQMIPHHQQAVDMAKLVPSRGTDPKVRELATRVQQAQDPEIQQLMDMLKKWNAAPQGMDHGSAGHGGMDTTHLEAAKGAEFDRMWLQMMIEHHQGAVQMSQTELSKGSSPEAKALAQKIIDAQQAEITEMQAMLK
ncbi:DUF305 domain-containing protein [Kibdelosporangium aridum]|uniref:DUF305 domain-containing protein n=1 Tax=Kibdelosporangium aridum TaxID=2030 RepID=UPI000524A3A5